MLGSREAVLHKYSEGGWVGDAAVQDAEQHIPSMSVVGWLAQGLDSSVDFCHRICCHTSLVKSIQSG